MVIASYKYDNHGNLVETNNVQEGKIITYTISNTVETRQDNAILNLLFFSKPGKGNLYATSTLFQPENQLEPARTLIYSYDITDSKITSESTTENRSKRLTGIYTYKCN